MTDQNPTWSQALAELRGGGGRAVVDQLLPGVYRELCAVRTVQRDWAKAPMLLRRALAV